MLHSGRVFRINRLQINKIPPPNGTITCVIQADHSIFDMAAVFPKKRLLKIFSLHSEVIPVFAAVIVLVQRPGKAALSGVIAPH